MATAKKRGNSWRCLVFDKTDANGKRLYKSFTAATKKEAEYLAADYVLNRKRSDAGKLFFKEARELYIEERKNVLSPATIRGYTQMQTYYEALDNLLITKIDERVIQKWANDFSETHAPKTVKNAHGFISAVMKEFHPDLKLNTRLPQKTVPKYTIPTSAQIDRIRRFYAEHDKDMLLAVSLACFGGLRRSEICSITPEDLSGNKLHVCHATVQGSDGKYIKKLTKNPTSDRYVELPSFLVTLLKENGCMVHLRPNIITRRFGLTLEKLKLPHFRFHDLRHYSASVAHALGVPDQFIQERHGWKNDTVLKAVYRNISPDFEKQFTEKLNSYFENMQP